MLTEADTCRKYVTPALQRAGWDSDPHALLEQHYFTDGRVIPLANGKAHRREGKKADYILRYSRDCPVAVVEAKAEGHPAAEGLEQAKEYAEILDLKYAYATNGREIIEFDFKHGTELAIERFPTPDELWTRLARDADPHEENASERILSPSYHLSGKSPRYYQEVAINRVLRAISKKQKRILLTMATGTGKTVVAFQICWKLWSSKWNRENQANRKPRILYLADRDILIDQPKDTMFQPFQEARQKIQFGDAPKSREMYFSTYQSIAQDERRPGLFREYPRDFFDLIIVDECHRGSARDESSWREILEYFAPAYQLGMTATPLRDENRDTYRYFGNPVYQYSLKQGIDDGFLAPYRVHRIVTDVDATGWRPNAGDLDRYGRAIPDEEYHTEDFERVVVLKARTEAIARSIISFLRGTNPMAKTIVFCVDQEHALAMRQAIVNLTSDMVQMYPDYVCRVTADEGDVGRGHLGRFQDIETDSPVILTTSRLLTTGVDAPTCHNIVIARPIGSMVEFKQIIGRGTRLSPDYGKLFFNILDYTGSATKHFADPDFDGSPDFISEASLDSQGNTAAVNVIRADQALPVTTPKIELDTSLEPSTRRKYYFDGGHVEVVAHMVHEIDPEGHQLRIVQYTDYTGEAVRSIYPRAADMRKAWRDPMKRAEIIERLELRGVSFEELANITGHSEADPFDLLCFVAYNSPLRSRRERVNQVRNSRTGFLARYSTAAREILEDLLEKYSEFGTAQFALPDVLKIPPISNIGNPIEIAELFGGPEGLRHAVNDLQTLLYSD